MQIILNWKFIKVFLYKSKIFKCNTKFFISLSTIIKTKCQPESQITYLKLILNKDIKLLFVSGNNLKSYF